MMQAAVAMAMAVDVAMTMALEVEVTMVVNMINIPDICHFFTQAKFLENKIYTKKTRKLRQNTQ